METSPRKLNMLFSYKDYLSWNNSNERWELIDGVAYDMSPAPTRKHQDISRNLFKELVIYLEDKECTVYAAP
ncbi:MAG: Uma2 family endonuclease, partial [Spirochaetes bacterium]